MRGDSSFWSRTTCVSHPAVQITGREVKFKASKPVARESSAAGLEPIVRLRTVNLRGRPLKWICMG